MHSRVTRTSEHLVSFENLSFMFSENKTLLNFYFKEINVLPIKTLINTRNKRKIICMFFRRLIAVRQECGTKPSDSLNFERCRQRIEYQGGLSFNIFYQENQQ